MVEEHPGEGSPIPAPSIHLCSVSRELRLLNHGRLHPTTVEGEMVYPYLTQTVASSRKGWQGPL
jgi:hypothetical protein